MPDRRKDMKIAILRGRRSSRSDRANPDPCCFEEFSLAPDAARVGSSDVPASTLGDPPWT
jgi:hypothetical protein